MAKGLESLVLGVEVMALLEVEVVLELMPIWLRLRLCGAKAKEIERKESVMRLTRERMLFITTVSYRTVLYRFMYDIIVVLYYC